MMHEKQDGEVTKWDEGQEGYSDTLGLWTSWAYSGIISGLSSLYHLIVISLKSDLQSTVQFRVTRE